jgi:hypothetical protein
VIYRETPLNTDFGIKNERQDWKNSAGYLWEGGWIEDMEVREYGWWASYTYMTQNDLSGARRGLGGKW